MDPALLPTVLPPAKRLMGKYCRGPRDRAITPGPFVPRVAMSSSRLPPAPAPLPGRRALDEEEAPGLGRVHVYLVFPGRREVMHVVTAGRGVPRRHPRASVMALQRQTFCPQAPLRPEASLGKTRHRLKGLWGVSCSQMLVVLVVPRAAQTESRAASLPVGAGVRITSALI